MSESETPKIRAVPRAPGSIDEEEGAALRCPYCHDVCDPAETVSCRACRAQHHPACWLELEACSVCRGRYRVEDGPERIPRSGLIERLYQGRLSEVVTYYREEGQSEDQARISAAALAFEELRRLGPGTFKKQRVPAAARITALGQAAVLGLCAQNAWTGTAHRSVVVVGLSMVFAFGVLAWLRVKRGPAAGAVLRRHLGLLVLALLGYGLLVLDDGAGFRSSSTPLAALCLVLGLGSALIAIPGRRMLRGDGALRDSTDGA